MRIFVLLIGVFFSCSTVLEAQTIITKTETKYRPLVEEGDTIGFYMGTKSNPFKSIKLFRCSQSKKFIESNPNMDYKWANSQLSREVYSLWNIKPIYNIGSENDIRLDNGKFFQGEKEITFHNFYEIILLIIFQYPVKYLPLSEFTNSIFCFCPALIYQLMYVLHLTLSMCLEL